MTLESDFHVEMLNIYFRAKNVGYNATRFLTMLEEPNSGVAVAKRLLSSDAVQTGFFELCQQGNVELTVENLVLQSRWRPLFEQSELDRANRRIREMNATPKLDL